MLIHPHAISMHMSCYIFYFKINLNATTQWQQKFVLQRYNETRAWALAFEIILEIDVILLKCNYRTGDMLIETDSNTKMEPK